MTDDGSHLLHHRTEFDRWQSLTIGIYMALVGYFVMVGLPVISTAWVDNLGFTEVQVGRVAGAGFDFVGGRRVHQVAVQRQCLRSAVYEGCVTLIHVGGDVVEQQRGCEGRGPRPSDPR